MKTTGTTRDELRQLASQLAGEVKDDPESWRFYIEQRRSEPGMLNIVEIAIGLAVNLWGEGDTIRSIENYSVNLLPGGEIQVTFPHGRVETWRRAQ